MTGPSLITVGPLPDLLGYALLSHGRAKCEALLEFSIPAFVRAAEGVIALRKGMGAKDFKDRALPLAPDLKTDAYVGADADSLLGDLYQLRSDCVHGKIPFLELRTQGSAGEDRAAKLQYVAEFVARSALLKALRFPHKELFATRDALESAWATGAFPSS